jgi:anti-anti-sigma factor
VPTRDVEARVRQHDGLAVIELHGRIDAGAEAAVNGAYAEASRDDPSAPLLLEFSGADYINSTGIALIVGLLARARAEGRGVTACGLSDHYRQIFEITRLSDFMRIVPDEESALTPSPGGRP